MLRTTAVFKCIVTFKNGTHRIVRMTLDKVAKMAAAIKQAREMPWLTRRYEDFFSELELKAGDIMSLRFINERTGQELLTL